MRKEGTGEGGGGDREAGREGACSREAEVLVRAAWPRCHPAAAVPSERSARRLLAAPTGTRGRAGGSAGRRRGGWEGPPPAEPARARRLAQ